MVLVWKASDVYPLAVQFGSLSSDEGDGEVAEEWRFG